MNNFYHLTSMHFVTNMLMHAIFNIISKIVITIMFIHFFIMILFIKLR